MSHIVMCYIQISYLSLLLRKFHSVPAHDLREIDVVTPLVPASSGWMIHGVTRSRNQSSGKRSYDALSIEGDLSQVETFVGFNVARNSAPR